jgi:hypothetical protein
MRYRLPTVLARSSRWSTACQRALAGVQSLALTPEESAVMLRDMAGG